MKKIILVVAPHPDDETLGCGGTLLKHQSQGDQVHWLITTKMNENYSAEQKSKRQAEIAEVKQKYGFQSVTILDNFTTELGSQNLNVLIEGVSKVFQILKPEVIYAPFYGDVHTDHYWTFRAILACSKSFRYSSVKKVLCYETVSETEFGSFSQQQQFLPQVFSDITKYLDAKINIMKIYQSELADFPHPRSEKNIRALAHFRGASSGVEAAEAFQLVKEIL